MDVVLLYSYCALYILTSLGNTYSIIEIAVTNEYASQYVFYIMDEFQYGIKPMYVTNAVRNSPNVYG